VTDAPTRTETLRRSTPREQGVDARGIAAFVDTLQDAPGVEPHSLMVIAHGHVVAEGWWRPYSADGVQLLYSLSKSFTSTALGFAVAEGLVSLDDTVLSHFPELDADVVDPRSRRMLVRHVASMASGHLTETIDRAREADPADLVRGFLLTPPDREPGTVFAYNQPCTYTVGAIVARRSGQSLTDYLRPRLLDPLGIGPVAWQADASGRQLGYSGLHATTDAIARLGLLYLQGGVWDGVRLLPREWVDEATRSQVDNAGNAGTDDSPDWQQGYGFQFWRGRHGYRGDGAYGQFCLVLPEHDAVVAITAATVDMQGVLDRVHEHLLPALAGRTVGGEPDPDAAVTADDELAARLAALALPAVPAAAEPASGTAWDGFVGRAPRGPVDGVSLERRDGGWRLTLAGRGSLTVPLPGPATPGGWLVADGSLPDGTPVPVAVTGGWTGARTLAVDVLFLQTPHRLRVECTLAGSRPGTADRAGAGDEHGAGAVTAEWLTEPLGGPSLGELRALLA
jgi:CubicO group peptidase (beta-lactamase class C family)